MIEHQRHGDVIVVAEDDRSSRSMANRSTIGERTRAGGVSFCPLNEHVDVIRSNG